MRKCVLAAVAAVGFGFVVSVASAKLLVFDGFEYNPAALANQVNPSNQQTWAVAGAQTPNAINVVSNSLTSPSGFPGAVGNSTSLTGNGNNSGSTVRVSLESPFAENVGANTSTGTIYYSFLMRVDNLTGSNNTIGGFFAGINNTIGAQATNPNVVGARLQGRIDPADATKYDLGIFSNKTATAAATSWSGPLTVGDTLLVVAGYTFNNGTSTDDVASLWLNPTSATFGAASAPAPNFTDTGGTDISGARTFLLRQSPAPQLTLDELRVGDSWASVTTAGFVPEPASMGLLSIAAASMCKRRRLG